MVYCSGKGTQPEVETQRLSGVVPENNSQGYYKMKQDSRTMDIINPELKGMPQVDYLQELNIRSHRAGYTTREGGPIPIKIMARGVGPSKLNIWPRDENRDLIGD